MHVIQPTTGLSARRPQYVLTWPVWVAFAGTLIAAGFALSALIFRTIPLQLPVCILYTTTQIPCATCGTTRAFWALARGHLMQALAFQPLILTLYIVCTALTGLDLTIWRLRGTQILPRWLRHLRLSGWSILVIVAANWLYLILYLSPRVHRWIGWPTWWE